MAVDSVIEIPQRTFGDTFDGSSYVRVFRVHTNARTDDGTIVRAGVGVAVGDAHPNDANALCKGVRGVENALTNKEDAGSVVADGSWWTVTCDYSSSFTDTQMVGSPLYPTRKAKLNGSVSVEERPIDFDKNGDPLANIAKMPFYPAITKLFVGGGLEIEVNLLEASEPSKATYEGKCNSATYRGAAAGTVMCQGIIKTGPFKEGGVEFYTYRIVLAYAAETWDVRHGKVLEQGVKERVAGVVRPIKINNREVTEPWPLKTVGADAVAIRDGDLTDAEFADFELYERTSFTGITYS